MKSRHKCERIQPLKKEIHIYKAFIQRAVPRIKNEQQELSQKAALLLASVIRTQNSLIPKQLEIERDNPMCGNLEKKQSLGG